VIRQKFDSSNAFGYRSRMQSLKKAIPQSVVKRLPKYLAYVQSLCAEDIEWVSSSELAEQLGLTSSTVRQDFSYFDFSGISKRGYEAQGLRSMLESILGADTDWKVVVVGAGNLGRALALHEEFARRGFHIVGIFDNDPAKVGTVIGSLTVEPLDQLEAAVKHHSAMMGIVAVPAAAAQSVADLLVSAGVSGLLNMALTHIIAPENVSVIDSRIVASLLELSHSVSFPRQ
jgi:redox-sensing transcriptional repressor